MTRNIFRRRALSGIYVAILFLPLLGLISLAVDMARMRLAHTQLQTAADASALAGVSALPDVPAAQSRAVTLAQENYCLKTPVALNAGQDVQFGIWHLPIDPNPAKRNTFELIPPNSGARTDPRRRANAVRTTPQRLVARGNPIRLWFAPAVGVANGNAQASAIAFLRGGPRSFGLVGLDSVSLNGSVTVDSYNASAGPYDPAHPNHNGSLASNGDISLIGSARVYGDVHPGVGRNVSQGDSVTVTGSESPLETSITYTLPTPPPDISPTKNNNALITSKDYNAANQTLSVKDTLVLPPGNYYFTQITVSAGGNLTFSSGTRIYLNHAGKGDAMTESGNASIHLLGPVTMWAYGNINVGGTFDVANNNPANFQLYGLGPAGSSIAFKGTPSLALRLNAPLADVTIQGTTEFYGSIVGKTLTFGGTVNVHYDESIPPNNQPYTVSLVK